VSYKSELLKHITNDNIVRYGKWYDNALEIAIDIANTNSIPLYKAIAVIAVLSPMNKWVRNVFEATTLITCYVNKIPCACQFATYPQQVNKAYRVMACGSESEAITIIGKGIKTLSFYHNISGNQNDYVTVDTWIVRAAGLECAKGKYPSQPIVKAIGQALKELASEYDCKVAALQAAIWVDIRGLE
jgi:hypothetical protein